MKTPQRSPTLRLRRSALLEDPPKRGRAARYHHGDLRRALVAAAVALLRRRGGKALTLREAARRAGVSQTAPYRHFRNKEALLAAVAEEGFRSLKKAIAAAAAAAHGPFAKLRATSVAYVRFAADHPQHYRVMFSPDVRGSRNPPLREAAVDAFSQLMEVIVEGAGTARAGGDDLGARALAAWALVHGLALLAVDDQLPPVVRTRFPLDRLAEGVTRVLFEGLGRVDPSPSDV